MACSFLEGYENGEFKFENPELIAYMGTSSERQEVLAKFKERIKT